MSTARCRKAESNHANNNEKDAKRAMMITADGEPLNRSAFQDELFGNGVSTISGKKFLG
ncbi:MAG: hypothetical protein IJ069_02350 [Prevotella sp.]|nr:hypothetical protein [Prevotella sp.]